MRILDETQTCEHIYSDVEIVGFGYQDSGFWVSAWWVLIIEMVGSEYRDGGFWVPRWWVLGIEMVGSEYRDDGFYG